MPPTADRPLIRRIYGLTIPLALSSQAENMVGVAEILMVGSLGAEAISAVGISRQIAMLVGVMMIAVNTGTIAMVSQAVGAGRFDEASATAKQSVTIVAIISGTLSVVGYFTADLFLQALSITPEVIALAGPYLRLFFVGLIFMGIQFTINTSFHAAGDTRTPLYILLTSNTSRIVLSYGFIFGHWGLPEMGVRGAAAAGIIGGAFGVAISFAALYSGRFAMRFIPGTPFRPEWERAKRLLKIGIPSAGQGVFRNGSYVVFLKLVAMSQMGTTAIAAYSIGSQFERILRRTGLAFGTAASSIVGHALGAGHPDEAEHRGNTALAVATGSIALLALPAAIFPEHLLRIFTEDAAVLAIGVPYLIALCIAEPFMCAAITAGGALRAAGDTIPALKYTIVAQWLVRLPAAWILAYVFKFDVLGLWAAIILATVLQGILTVRKLRRGEWKSRSL